MAARGNWGRSSQNYYGGGAYGGTLMSQQIPYYMANMPSTDRRYQPSGYGGGGGNAGGAKSGGGAYRDERRRDDRKRPRSPERRNNEPRHDSRPPRHGTGKYEVRLPKSLFVNNKTMYLHEIRQRVSRSSVPNELCHVTCNWTTSFPLGTQMPISMDCDMHVFHKDAELPNQTIDQTLLAIDDCDYSYSVRVMLLGTPSLAEVYKSTCRMADEVLVNEKVNPAKLFSFLVASRGKSDQISIGGPWSPSRDGPNPENCPETLVNTAIRYVKGFLGLDFSSCTEWIRFLELRYHRPAGSKAPGFLTDNDRDICEDQEETVVFFIPVISHLLPSDEEWEQLKANYAKILETRLHPNTGSTDKMESQQATETTLEDSQIVDDSINLSQAGEPTHWSKLDVNTMKVNDLKTELVSRGLDAKGLKANLISRLQTALDEEKAKDNPVSTATSEIEINVDPEQQRALETDLVPESESSGANNKSENTEEGISDKDKRRLERIYRLPEKPMLLLHPNYDAKTGNGGSRSLEYFRVSLSSLMDNRGDEKELSFELHFFAQQFNEMLQRDAIFNIYKAFCKAPEQSPSSDDSNAKELNGTKEEPEAKRPAHPDLNGSTEISEAQGEKIRKHKRTIDALMLYSFVFFDTGNCEYIKEHDLLEMFTILNLGYSRIQFKKLIARCKKNKDNVYYRNLTDLEVTEGSEDDVVNLLNSDLTKSDSEFVAQLLQGNKGICEAKAPCIPAKVIIVGSGSDENIMRRLEIAESTRKSVELQFHKLKEEFENARVKLNGFKDIEDKLRSELKEVQGKYRTEVRTNSENKQTLNAYGRLLREAKSSMDKCLTDINRQFEKEREKREAELKLIKEAEESKKSSTTNDQEEKKDSLKKEDDIVLDTA